MKKLIKKVSRFLLKAADDITLLFGVIMLSIGAFKIYIPAGYITLGICFIAFAFLLGKRGVK